MGNSMFCSIGRSEQLIKTALLFDAQGCLQRVELPAKAAELMLEAPGSIVCPVDELRKSRGIWALRADEDLQAGKFYLMFPAKRVYCKASQLEMKLIDAACRKKGKTPGPKVFPAPTTNTATAEDEGNEEDNSTKLLVLEEDHRLAGFSSCRFSLSKQWRPMLEPIHETS